MKRKILFVDDEPRILEGLQGLLRKHRAIWDMAFAPGSKEALAELEKAPFDVIVSDMRMPLMDGATLLKNVKELYPNVVRIALSGHADLETTMRAVPVAHQFLSKPCEPDVLENVIERACKLQALIGNDTVLRVIGKIDKLPSVPKVYARLIDALGNDRTTMNDVAGLIKQDMAMSAKILQVVNSAFFRLSRRISSLEEAVSYLGMNHIKHLALALEVFRQGPSTKTSKEISVDKIQEHAMFTASIAAEMMTEKRQKEDAFLAGLLHDIGKLIMIHSLPGHVENVLRTMSDERLPMHEAEGKLYQTSHAEVGAYLLGIWGIPYTVVEAVANHHTPTRVEQPHFEVLSAVYLANELANEVAAETITETTFEKPPIDLAFLEKLGVAERVPRWRVFAQKISDRFSSSNGKTV
jgi:putative nucleotidyltransferase with HDIG domain